MANYFQNGNKLGSTTSMSTFHLQTKLPVEIGMASQILLLTVTLLLITIWCGRCGAPPSSRPCEPRLESNPNPTTSSEGM